MNREEEKEKLIKQIEIYKNNALENIQNEEMIPLIWDIVQSIDLKAQLGMLTKILEE